MTARELRIGNYINPKFPMKVVNIFPDEVNADFEGNEGDVFEFKNEDIEGVPIDEEWLKKINLVSVGGDFVRFNKLRCFLLRRDNSGYYYGLPNNSMRTEVKFIHQLQNLYFALTGEEIEFK